MEIIYGYYSDKGIRNENQDSVLILDGDYIKTFAVADGVGGLSFGAEAGRLTLDAFASELNGIGKVSADYLKGLIDLKYRQINEHMGRISLEKGIEMATTAAMLNFTGERYILSNVGDTKITRVRGGQLKNLSQVHSLAGFDKDGRNSSRNVLTMAVGVKGTFKPYIATDRFKAGDCFIIWSDGAYNYIGEEQIRGFRGFEGFRDNTSLDELSRNLAELALQNGSPDNISIVIIKINS